MPTIFYVSYVALWLLLLVGGLLLLLVYRHFGLIALGTADGVQRDGLPVGEVAPALNGVASEGRTVRWETQRGRPGLPIFASPDCEPCADVLPYVNQLAAIHGQTVAVTAMVAGPWEQAAKLIERFGPTYVFGNEKWTHRGNEI